MIRLATHRLRLALILAFLSWAPAAFGQGTELVAPSDLAYRDVDRLVELGLVDGVVMGQRPYSRREFARVVGLVRLQLDRESARRGYSAVGDMERVANAILQRLSERFGDVAELRSDDTRVSLVDAASLQFLSTDAVQRGFPGNLTRELEASIEPLPFARLGRRALPGSTLALELQQRVQATRWLAFRARERLEYRIPNDTTRSRRDGEVLLASIRATYRNVALTVGREQLAWAQSAGAGLFVSSDAPALDLVSLASDHPVYLPGFLERVGPTQATLFVADLGPSQVRSNSRLLGYKVSVQPHRSVEVGGSFLNHFGGAGGPSASFGDRLIDFLPFVDIFRTHNYVDSTRTLDVNSDKLLGLDGRIRFPALAGVTLSGEVLIDDFDVRRIPQLFAGSGASQVAVHFPRLGSSAWALRLSAKHTGIYTYAHTELTSGIRTRGRLIGDELGPDAKAYGAELSYTPYWPVRIAVEGRAAIYSDADYEATYPDPGQPRFEVRKVASRDPELRDRIRASFEFQSDEGVALVIRGGGERVRNLNFMGQRRNEYLFDVALRLRQ